MEWHKFISAPESAPNKPTGTSHLAKALRETKASQKRRASETIREARVRSSPLVTCFSSRTDSIASETTTSTSSRAPGFLRSCLEGVSDHDQLPKSKKPGKDTFSINTESGPANGNPPQGATFESDDYRSPWRIFVSSFQKCNPDGDATDMMSQSNASHEGPSTTDFGIRNSPATK